MPNVAKVIGKMVTNPDQEGMAVYVLSKFVDKRPELLNCQQELLVDALEGRISSTQLSNIVNNWTQASLVNKVNYIL